MLTVLPARTRRAHPCFMGLKKTRLRIYSFHHTMTRLLLARARETPRLQVHLQTASITNLWSCAFSLLTALATRFSETLLSARYIAITWLRKRMWQPAGAYPATRQ